MAATSRVVTLMTEDEKTDLDRKAKHASREWGRNVSAAEIVREAVRTFDVDGSPEQQNELRALLAAFETIHPETLARVARAEAALDDALAYFDRKRAL